MFSSKTCLCSVRCTPTSPHKIVPLARVVLGVNMDPLDVGNRLLPLLSDSGLRLPIVAVLQVSGNY